QSPDIAGGVDQDYEARQSTEDRDETDIGAGDQGFVFGFACDETENLMPLPVFLAHRLRNRLTGVRKNGTLDCVKPDGWAQLTIEYDDQDRAVRVDTVIVSTQHHEDSTNQQIEDDIHEHVIQHVIPSFLLDDHTKYYINPSGRFVIGGPQGDAGLTGRKIMV